jgi:RimJ/RimL family protein N-acetyltransferase
MKLLPIESPETIRLVAEWLCQPENYQWLDFGNGIQRLTAASLKIMAQRDIYFLRVFTSDMDDAPIGVVGLNNIDRNFKTAASWIVLGEKKYSGRGYPARAASKILALGFTELGLHAINAWTLDCNYPVIRMLRRLNFRPIGLQRQCHYMNGRCHDRLLFDILDSEYKEL